MPLESREFLQNVRKYIRDVKKLGHFQGILMDKKAPNPVLQ